MSTDDHANDHIDEVAVERLMRGDTTIPLRRNDLPGRPLSCDTVEAIRRMAARGLNDVEMGKALGGRMSREAVGKTRNRYGIPAHPDVLALAGRSP